MKIYHSASFGDLILPQVKERIVAFMKESENHRYRVIIGTDSQKKQQGTDFVTAIIIHRIGVGGIYFWERTFDTNIRVLKQRIFEEATRSLTTAQEFFELFKSNGIAHFDFEIHVDMGKSGPTREWITEVVSMIRRSGFVVRTKPYSYGASKVADRHT